MEDSIDFAFWLLHQTQKEPTYFSREEVEEFYIYYIKEVKED